ncbi:MAG TPA: hypothetical protein VJI67_01410, partial [archaeon]|nr:hypothetical protein [archaeon]
MLRRPLLALLLFSVFFSSLSSAVMTSDGGGGGGICSCGPNQACTDCRNDGCHRCTPVPVSIDLIWDSVTWALNAVFAALNLVLNQVPPITCGNGWCDGGESYLTCPLDCEPPQLLFYCGDGVCNLEGEEGRESCSSCPTDCGNCGGPCSVDTSIDTFNCGSCGNNCLADALNPKVCVGGSCATVLCGQQGLAACPQGTACTSEGYCTDTRADSLNCGVGQINCLSDPTKPRACVDGLCTPYYCSEGDEQLCNRFGGDAKCCALTEETEIRVMWPNFKLCAGTGIDPSDLENLSIPELGNGECSGSGGNSGLKCSVYCDFLQTGLAYCESEWGNCVPRDPETPCNSYCWIASGLAYCDYSNACVAVVPELPAEVVLG